MANKDEDTPPKGYVSVMGARLPPPPKLPRESTLGKLGLKKPLAHPPPLPRTRPSPPEPPQQRQKKTGTLPGFPSPPPPPLPPQAPEAPAYQHVPEISGSEPPTTPASPAYRERCLIADFRCLTEGDRRRIERHVQALLSFPNQD